MNNIVSVKLDSRYASTLGVWQYDYGQVLRITGPEHLTGSRSAVFADREIRRDIIQSRHDSGWSYRSKDSG